MWMYCKYAKIENWDDGKPDDWLIKVILPVVGEEETGDCVLETKSVRI